MAYKFTTAVISLIISTFSMQLLETSARALPESRHARQTDSIVGSVSIDTNLHFGLSVLEKTSVSLFVMCEDIVICNNITSYGFD